MKSLHQHFREQVTQSAAAGLTLRAARGARNALHGSQSLDKSTVERNALAATLLAVAILLGSGMAVCIRLLETFSAFQIVFLRSVVVISVLLPILLSRGVRFWRTQQPGMLLCRGIAGSAGQTLTVLAVLSLPLATVQALSFTKAFMVVGLSILFLGEAVSWRRWAAIVAGFVGVVIVVDPRAEYDPAVLFALSGTLAFAGALVLAKMLLKGESRGTLMIWNAGTQFVISLVPALLTWKQLGPTDMVLFLSLGALVLVVQPISLQAFRLGEMSALAPVDYLRLLTGATMGFLFFGEVPGPTLWIGAAIIIGANLWIQGHNRA